MGEVLNRRRGSARGRLGVGVRVVEHGSALVHVVGVVGRGEGHRGPGLGLVARPTPANAV